MHYPGRAGSSLTAGHTFPVGAGKELDRLCAHMKAPSRTACNGFHGRGNKLLQAQAPIFLSRDFWISEGKEKERKKKIIITKKRALQFAQKGLEPVKPDSEMEPGSGDNSRDKGGRGARTLWGQRQAWRPFRLKQDRVETSATRPSRQHWPHTPPSAVCPPPSQVGEPESMNPDSSIWLLV